MPVASLVAQFRIYFKGVIPKPRAFTSGARDLAPGISNLGTVLPYRSEGETGAASASHAPGHVLEMGKLFLPD